MPAHPNSLMSFECYISAAPLLFNLCPWLVPVRWLLKRNSLVTFAGLEHLSPGRLVPDDALKMALTTGIAVFAVLEGAERQQVFCRSCPFP